jgi:hypothetical protein
VESGAPPSWTLEPGLGIKVPTIRAACRIATKPVAANTSAVMDRVVDHSRKILISIIPFVPAFPASIVRVVSDAIVAPATTVHDRASPAGVCRTP